MSTPVILLDRLQEFTQDAVKDILLPTKATEKKPSVLRPPEVWKMRLPDVESGVSKIPYIILQLLNGADIQEEGKHPWSSCNIRIIVGAYSEDESEGALFVLNVLDRLREKLLRERVVGRQFTLQLPLEYLVIPDTDTTPFFFGEMMSVWQLPTINREVPEKWQGETRLPTSPQLRLDREIRQS